jgi:SNF2 family DNA or RNA helicase
MADEFQYEKLVMLNNAYNCTLSPNNTFVTPQTIKTALYPHQKTTVHGMHQHREKMTRGFMIENQAINGKVGILGDPPGTGKTLSALAYLASSSVTPKRMTSELTNHSTKYFFSHEIHSLQEGSAHLIIVPHRLFGQWKQEIEQHTTMAYVPIETKRIMRGDSIANAIQQKRVVLTTNKCYKYVQEYATRHHIQWDNIMIDEATSIYFQSSDPPLRFQYLWLITNNWIPLISSQPAVIKSNLYFLRDRVNLHPDLEQWLLEDITVHYEGVLVSSTFLKEYVSFFHPHRGTMIVRNSSEYLVSSIKLPNPTHEILQCKPNITFASLTSFYLARQREPSFRTRQIPHLFQALGIEFQSISEYKEQQSTAKHALIDRMVQDNECVICLESCEYPTMVRCCYHIYCGKCLLKNTLISMKCPTCREGLQIHHMCCLGKLSTEDRMLSQNKMEVCLDQIRNHKNGKFIIYSPFSNIYYELLEKIDNMGMKAERIENNLFSLIKTVRNFQQGKTNILFISNVDAIRGVSLSSTTHLLFYHELPAYESKQILIHSSQRMGRTTPLQILHLNSEIPV